MYRLPRGKPAPCPKESALTSPIAYRSALALAATLLLSASAQAQLFRAYLSPTGSDANPCTLPQPCRLLPAALTVVADGGEIWMLDSANYNSSTVNIIKSVTILAVPGALGSVVATGGSAISIATAGVKVALRNLVVVPLPGAGGTFGVVMTNGSALTVESCLFASLQDSAILVSTPATLRVSGSTIRDNGFGISLAMGARATVARSTISGNTNYGVSAWGQTAGNTTTLDVIDSTVSGNGFGVHALSTNATGVAKISVTGSEVAGNNFGILAYSGNGAAVTISASRNMVSNNTMGMKAESAGARVWASGNTVSDNTVGLQNDSAVFESTQNNAVRNNATNTMGTISLVAPE
jgi:hypothetical protein